MNGQNAICLSADRDIKRGEDIRPLVQLALKLEKPIGPLYTEKGKSLKSCFVARVDSVSGIGYVFYDKIQWQKKKNWKHRLALEGDWLAWN